MLNLPIKIYFNIGKTLGFSHSNNRLITTRISNNKIYYIFKRYTGNKKTVVEKAANALSKGNLAPTASGVTDSKISGIKPPSYRTSLTSKEHFLDNDPQINHSYNKQLNVEFADKFESTLEKVWFNNGIEQQTFPSTLKTNSYNTNNDNNHFITTPKTETQVFVSSNTNQVPIRGMACLRAGTVTGPVPKTVPSTVSDIPEEVQTDFSGFHKIITVTVCSEPQCSKRNCIDEHSCETLAHKDKVVTESAGHITHKIPSNKIGELLDNVDGNGLPLAQHIVREHTVIPLDMSKFKQNSKLTEYVQDDARFKKIIQGLPNNSVLKLKDNSLVDTPFDDGF